MTQAEIVAILSFIAGFSTGFAAGAIYAGFRTLKSPPPTNSDPYDDYR